MSEIFSDLAASNISLKSASTESVLKIGHHDLLIWDNTKGWQINPAFLLHAASKITWTDNDNNSNIDPGELGFLDNLSSVPTKIQLEIPQKYIVNDEESNGIITCIIADTTKRTIKGLKGTIYYLTSSNYDNCKAHVFIDNNSYTIIGSSVSNNSYLDLYGNVTNTNYGQFFTTVLNFEQCTNINKILFEPENDKGSFYELDVPYSMKNIDNTETLINIPKNTNLHSIDNSWIILSFEYTQKIYFDIIENTAYRTKTTSALFNSINYVDVHAYSTSVLMYVEIHGVNVDIDMLFIEETETKTLVGESYDCITTDTGVTMFIVLLHGDNVEKNYSFYYYNGNLQKLYLYGKMSLNVKLLETYDIFNTYDSPLTFNNYNKINTRVKSKYDWVSISVKPKTGTFHTITDLFASLLTQDQGKVLDGIRTKNSIWTISESGIIGTYYDGISWKTNTSIIVPTYSLLILQTNPAQSIYNWTYTGKPYINGENIAIPLSNGLNWIGYPLQVSTNISEYTEMYANLKSIRNQEVITVKNFGSISGTLDKFVPNEGYIIEVSTPCELTFKNTLEFMITQELDNIYYTSANDWNLDISIGSPFVLSTINSTSIELTYSDTIVLSLVSGNPFSLNKSIFKYTINSGNPLATLGTISNIYSIEVDIKYGFVYSSTKYYNNVYGKIKILTKEHIYAQSVVTEYNYTGYVTTPPVPSVAPSPVPSVAPSPVPSVAPSPVPSVAPSPVPSVAPSPALTDVTITQSANIGFTSLSFNATGTNMTNWKLIVKDVSNNILIDKTITSNTHAENITYYGTINVEAYALDGGVQSGTLFSNSYYIDLQITDLIISQSPTSYDVSITPKTNTNTDIYSWTIKTSDNYIPLTTVADTTKILTFDSTKEGSINFIVYALVSGVKSGNDYNEAFNITKPLIPYISNVSVIISPMDTKTKLTFSTNGYNITHWYLKVTQDTGYIYEQTITSSLVFEYEITNIGTFSYEAYALDSGVKSGSSYTDTFNVVLQITDLQIAQVSSSLDVNINPSVNGTLGSWTVRTTDDSLPLTTTSNTTFTYTFPASGEKTFEAYANIDDMQSGPTFTKSFSIASLSSIEPNVTFYINDMGNDGTHNISDVYINMNNLFSINGISSDTFNITTISVEFSDTEYITIVESGTNTSEYTNFSYIANGKMFTYYSTLSSGVMLNKSKQLVTRLYHTGTFSGIIPSFNTVNTMITGQNYIETNVQLVSTGLLKKKNLNFETNVFNLVKQMPSYYGDISAPYGLLTILDFINFIKIIVKVSGYAYEEITTETSVFKDAFDADILKQAIQIDKTNLSYTEMLSRKPTILDAIKLLKMVVGIIGKIPFSDKKPPENTPSQIFEGNVDLGSGFFMEANDDITDPILQFTYNLDGIKTPLITLKAQEGDALIVNDVEQGSTKISEKWVLHWPRDESSINRDFYITYNNGFGPVPQTLVIPDTNPLNLDPKYSVSSVLELGKLWAMTTSRGVVDIYYRETQSTQFYPQVIVGKNIYTSASYIMNDDEYYYSDYTTDDGEEN